MTALISKIIHGWFEELLAVLMRTFNKAYFSFCTLFAVSYLRFFFFFQVSGIANPCASSCSFVITRGRQLTPDHFNQNARAAKIIALSISQSAAGPLFFRRGELAASRSDFEDK